MSDAQFGWLEYPLAVSWGVGQNVLTIYAYNGRGTGAPWAFDTGIGLNVGGIFIELENTSDALPPISRVSSSLPPHVSPPPILLQHPLSPCPKAQAQSYDYWRYATFTATHEPLSSTDTRVTATCLSLNTIKRDFRVPDNILVISGSIVGTYYVGITVPNTIGVDLHDVTNFPKIDTATGEGLGTQFIPISGGGHSPTGFFTIKVDLKKMVIL